MIDYLEEIDRMIVLGVNSWHSPVMDELMWWISQRIVWVPLYLILAYLAWSKLPRRTFFMFLISALAAVALADLISVHLFKNVFLRYRPSHNTLLTDQLHFYQLGNGDYYKGGMYGFVSSHAANFFCMAVFTGLGLRRYFPRLIWYLLVVALVVSFSRLYQGVHYLSDLFVGGLLGATVAYLVHRFIYHKLIERT